MQINCLTRLRVGRCLRGGYECNPFAWLVAGLIALAGPGLPTMAATSASSSSGEAPAPQLVAQGSEFYETSCPQCHGDEAQGAEGPNLHNLPISNAQIAATIKYGIKGNMPAFGKKFDDHQIAALVAYLRTLR
jgi:mono/diheme cytochrome c family protein